MRKSVSIYSIFVKACRKSCKTDIFKKTLKQNVTITNFEKTISMISSNKT